MKRFWSKVKKTENCWNWIGSNNGAGYGEIRIKGKKVYAHRWSYEDVKGKIPKGYQIDHLCKNPSCVKPEHLEAVTPKVNVNRGNTSKPHLIKEFCINGHSYAKYEYKRKDGKGRNCAECVRTASRNYQRRKRNK